MNEQKLEYDSTKSLLLLPPQGFSSFYMYVNRFWLRMSLLWTRVILTRPQAVPLLPGCVSQVPVPAAAAADPKAAGSQGWLCTSTEHMELSFKISFSQQ